MKNSKHELAAALYTIISVTSLRIVGKIRSGGNKMANRWASSFPIILSILYAGILLGVSFLATPIKFSSTILSLQAALDVGKVTFHALIILEWILSCSCVISFLFNPFHKLNYILIFIIIVILIIQTFWLLPILDSRIILIQQDQIPGKAYYHLIYIAADTIKLLALLLIGFSNIQRNWIKQLAKR